MVRWKPAGCYGGTAAENAAKNMPPACFLHAATPFTQGGLWCNATLLPTLPYKFCAIPPIRRRSFRQCDKMCGKREKRIALSGESVKLYLYTCQTLWGLLFFLKEKTEDKPSSCGSWHNGRGWQCRGLCASDLPETGRQSVVACSACPYQTETGHTRRLRGMPERRRLTRR